MKYVVILVKPNPKDNYPLAIIDGGAGGMAEAMDMAIRFKRRFAAYGHSFKAKVAIKRKLY